jgi:hypothetical protein
MEQVALVKLVEEQRPLVAQVTKHRLQRVKLSVAEQVKMPRTKRDLHR